MYYDFIFFNAYGYLNLRKFAKMVRGIIPAQFLCFLGTIMHFQMLYKVHTLFESKSFVLVV